MADTLLYRMERRKMGLAVIINNLDQEQTPTKKDVEAMGQVLKTIGFEVQIHKNLTSQQMSSVKRKFTDQAAHSQSNCFVVLVISHGTSDNFLQDKDGNRTWNIESLITEVSDISTLVGRPKLFFIEACRGKEQNFSQDMMSKSSPMPQAMSGISLPSKQDIFVGFATVPGFVSFTSALGSPYLQALAEQLADHHNDLDLADIHLLVKRQLSTCKLGLSGARQGAEERSSLLSKLKFSHYKGSHRGTIVGGSQGSSSPWSTWTTPGPAKPIQPIKPTPVMPIPGPAKPIQPVRPTQVTVSRPFNTSSSPSKPLTFSGSIPSILNSRSTLSSSNPTNPYISPYSRQITPTTVSSNDSLKPTQLHPSLIPFSTASSRIRSISTHEPSSVSSTTSILPSTFLTRPRSATDIPIAVSRSTRNTAKADVTKHVVYIDSKDIERGLSELLEKVTELYGGKGEVKVSNNFRRTKKTYSYKYKNGTENGKKLLDDIAKKVNDMEEKEGMWTFTQTITLKTVGK